MLIFLRSRSICGTPTARRLSEESEDAGAFGVRLNNRAAAAAGICEHKQRSARPLIFSSLLAWDGDKPFHDTPGVMSPVLIAVYSSESKS